MTLNQSLCTVFSMLGWNRVKYTVVHLECVMFHVLQGIHLIKHAAWRTLERGAQFVLLGSAPDPRVQASSVVAWSL